MANMKTIKCNFKNITIEDKAKFKDSKCLLLISVGQESHEKEHFSATIDLLNGSFKFCIISLYDTLQRYTMALNSKKDPIFFHDSAKKEGDLWLKRNSKYYEKLSMPKKIFRWNEWLNHINFLEQKNKLMSLIQEDPSYKLVFDVTIDKYLDRYRKHLNGESEFDLERAKRICFDYILEECTVLCLWSELNCQFEIYPNVHNEAIEETRKRFVYTQHPNLLNPLTIRFRNAKQLAPQKFTCLQRNKNKELEYLE